MNTQHTENIGPCVHTLRAQNEKLMAQVRELRAALEMMDRAFNVETVDPLVNRQCQRGPSRLSQNHIRRQSFRRPVLSEDSCR